MSFKELIKTAESGFFSEVAHKKPPTLATATTSRQTAGPLKMPASRSTAYATGGRGFQGSPVAERSPRLPMSSTQKHTSAQAKNLLTGDKPKGFAAAGFQQKAGVPFGKPGAQAAPALKSGAGSLTSSAGRSGQFAVASKVHTPFKKKASAKELIKSAQGMAPLANQSAKSLLSGPKPTSTAVSGAAKKGLGTSLKGFGSGSAAPQFGFGASAPPKLGTDKTRQTI